MVKLETSALEHPNADMSNALSVKGSWAEAANSGETIDQVTKFEQLEALPIRVPAHAKT